MQATNIGPAGRARAHPSRKSFASSFSDAVSSGLQSAKNKSANTLQNFADYFAHFAILESSTSNAKPPQLGVAGAASR
jgi:hypothetical protein